jgi:hypothetical protein
MRTKFLPWLLTLSAIIGILFGLTVGARGFVLPPSKKVVTVTTNQAGLLVTNSAFIKELAPLNRRNFQAQIASLPLSSKIRLEARDWLYDPRLWWGLPVMLVGLASMVMIPRLAVVALRRHRSWASHRDHHGDNGGGEISPDNAHEHASA